MISNGAIKIVHIAPWHHYSFKTKISLATARIYCTTSLPLSRAMEDSPGPAAANPLSSKASTSQLTTHVQHVVERIVVAREHRQTDGGRWLGTMLRW